MTPILLSILLLILLVALIAIGVPIYASFGAVALFYGFSAGIDLSYLVGGSTWSLGSFAMLALPLFILAGYTMERSGVTDSLIRWVNSLVGGIKGSLGAVSVISTALFGAISGSNASAVATIGTILIPQLQKAGYDVRYATALIACAAPIATLIPPSIAMILFSITAGLPVTVCFLSTIAPGIIITIGYVIFNYFAVRNDPNITVLKKEPFNIRIKEIGIASLKGGPGLFMPLLVLGGIYSGKFSPTEAAAMAVVYVIFIGVFVYRKLTLKAFFTASIGAGRSTGIIMVMMFFILALGRELILGGFPEYMASFILDIASGNTILVLLMLNVALLIIGMFLDDCSGSILAAILLLPLAIKAGIHPIHFAAIAGVNLGMGNVTPPCAPLLLMAGAISNTPLKDYLWWGIKMQMTVHFPTVLLVTYIPGLALFLPKLIMGIQ